MTERRAVPRQRTFFNGIISYQNGTASENCLVRNMSEAGAHIELAHPQAPETFELVLPMRGFRASAQVIWNHGARFGLRLKPLSAAKAARVPAQQDEGY